MKDKTADTGLTLDRPVEELHRSINEQYDTLSEMYEQTWGDHISHGYWDLDNPKVSQSDARQRLAQELIAFGGVPAGARVLDSGCGIGASAIRLARDLDCQVDGINLGEQQVRRATEKAAEAGVADKTRFRVLDAMRTDYEDETFDLVWSVESCELMPDKREYLAECLRVLKPGGRLVLSSWCCRDDQLTAAEVKLLRRLYEDIALSYVLPLEHHAKLCADLGYAEVDTADWTPHVVGTWQISADIVKRMVLRPSNVWKLARVKGIHTFRFLNSMQLMKKAYDREVMRYGVLRATKPS